MKKITALFLLCVFFTGCKNTQNNAELFRFHKEIDTFCNNIKEIDSSINAISNISADEDGLKQATSELLNQLDLLKDEFLKFSNIDFPEEYDYLEKIADESADYMTEAVNAYHKTYEDNYTVSMEEYALENYGRAYKRVRVIIDVLNGKETTS